MIDSETFRGIHSRLPELGGAVLEATQKLLRNNQAAGPNAQELVELFSMPPTASLGEGTGTIKLFIVFQPDHRRSAELLQQGVLHSVMYTTRGNTH